MGQQRTRISTNNESFEESNQYTSPVRSQTQSTIQVNNNEVEQKDICIWKIKSLL